MFSNFHFLDWFDYFHAQIRVFGRLFHHYPKSFVQYESFRLNFLRLFAAFHSDICCILKFSSRLINLNFHHLCGFSKIFVCKTFIYELQTLNFLNVSFRLYFNNWHFKLINCRKISSGSFVLIMNGTFYHFICLEFFLRFDKENRIILIFPFDPYDKIILIFVTKVKNISFLFCCLGIKRVYFFFLKMKCSFLLRLKLA